MSNKNPNDQRADVKNPNNPAYQHDQRNREEQREHSREVDERERERPTTPRK